MKINKVIYVMLLASLVICSINSIEGHQNIENDSTRTDTITVTIATVLGEIDVELYRDKAPITVDNFLRYVNDEFYSELVFHRVIEDFMIQGGGFYVDRTKKDTTYPAIKNEAATSGMRNLRGTIAMARTNDPNSATCQFYINHVNNPSLDWDYSNGDGYGYCVFGEVTYGIEAVDEIAKVETDDGDWPTEEVMIYEIFSNSDYIPDDDIDDDVDDDDVDDDDVDDDDIDEITRPDPPGNLRITAGDGYVELKWEAPDFSGGSPITFYDIYRSATAGQNHKQVGRVDGNTLSYRDNSVENGQTYYYYIVAENDNSLSDSGGESSVTPQKVGTNTDPPRNLRVTAGDGYVELTWEAPDFSGGSPIEWYNIWRSTTAGQNHKQVGRVDGNKFSYRDTDEVKNGQTYYYYIVAENDNSLSDSGGESSVTPQRATGDGDDDIMSFIPLVIGVIVLLAIIIIIVIRIKKR